MGKIKDGLQSKLSMSRRNFVQLGGAIIAGSTWETSHLKGILPRDEEPVAKIKAFRKLGRTGFSVSDIGMGTNRNIDASIIRYAYDHGINYFDTAEGYGNGGAERTLGEALKFMDRKKVFISTKIHISSDESEQSIIDRFQKCLERLGTEYADALFMHGVTRVSDLDHVGYHAAIARLRSEGRVKFTGLSSHGPRGNDGDSMEKVLCAAAEDGRFDVMLLVYNFMNQEAGDNILAACKKHNVGTTAMKTAPGIFQLESFDPENPTPQQQENLDRMVKRGASREEAIERMRQRLKDQQANFEKTKPFLEKYQIRSQDQLRIASIHWVIQNPDMHSTCVSFTDFDFVDKMVPLSGTKLSRLELEFLENYRLAFNHEYCRHGCQLCAASCPHRVPVSTIMRYVYYFEFQGQEKYAMQRYASLAAQNGGICTGCDAPCLEHCPYHIDIPAKLSYAHSLLTLA
ncbi:MAG: aldo/keto reductase [candidate division KSB1 bacterium]|nr:aldo/keto reductase [candidate division KSB1 bacterium]